MFILKIQTGGSLDTGGQLKQNKQGMVTCCRIFCVRDWSRVACRRFAAAATERKARPSGALPEGHAHMLFVFCFYKVEFIQNLCWTMKQYMHRLWRACTNTPACAV